MCAAIGGTVPAKPARGELWVDVRDFGAKGDGGVTDNTAAFQAAVDAAITRLGSVTARKAVVFIPSSPKPYMVTKTIWVDSENIEIRGEGFGSHVYMHGYFKHSVFMFGVRRVESGYINGQPATAVMNASFRPDLYGKLDSSAAPTTGLKWGLRTNGNSYAHFQSNSVSSGQRSSAGYPYLDNWSETTKLTLEFCIEPPDGQKFPPISPILGMGHIIYEASPFLVYASDTPDILIVQFRTADQGDGLFMPKRSFAIQLTGATAPYRIAIQFDLDNAVCSAFVNGVQKPLVWQIYMTPTGPYPWAPGLGLKFQQNENNPFLIGAHGWSPLNPGSYTPTGTDLRLYGLRMSNTLRYQNNGPGQPQRRVDNPAAAITDAYAYFTEDANTINHLLLTDNPATAGRVINVAEGDVAGLVGISSGYFLSTLCAGGIYGNAVRDIAIDSANGGGQTISLGGVLETTIENVKVNSGFNGIGNLVLYANYNVYIRNCWIDGTDSPFFGAFQITNARDITINSVGRVGLRHLGGVADWRNVFVAFSSPITECVAKIRNGLYGGMFSFSNVLVDFEGAHMTLAAFFCETIEYSPSTSLRMTDIYIGTIGSNAALVMLRDGSKMNNDFLPCWIKVDNIQAVDTTYTAIVDVDGPLWHGEFEGGDLRGTRLIHQGKWGQSTSVVLRETLHVAPPRSRYWYKGAHVFEVRSPADAQFVEWRCTSTGVYGTPTPPTWAGLNPIASSPDYVAAYVLNNGYITANLT